MAPSFSLKAKGNLRRANEVQCPCSNFEFDSILLETETVKFDLHRKRSCTEERQTRKGIYWTPIAIDMRPDSDFVQPIDGIKWNHLSALYDEDLEYYSCTRNDYRMDNIEPNEAKACMELIDNTCKNVMPKLCDFDLTDLEKVKGRAKNGGFMIDQQKSCKIDSQDDYGIYEKLADTQVHVGIETKQSFSLNQRKSSASNASKTAHCSNLVDDTCSAWKISSSSEVTQCQDDANFELQSNFVSEDLENVYDILTHSTRRTIKNCAWVAKDLSRCRVLDRSTQKRVFESCRQICGYCACSNNENYTFNAQPEMNCDWIAKDSSERCNLEWAKKNCKSTCSTNCCKDNSKFTFGESHKTCEWVAGNKTRLAVRCSRKTIAANCPETCGLCPI